MINVNDLIERAWGAVKRAEVPEHLQPVALTAAIEFLRDENGTRTPKAEQPETRNSTSPPAKQRDSRDNPSHDASSDEGTFFRQLAHESGVDETVLRDVLQLKAGSVHVLSPTRLLGKTKAEQSRQVIALVAGAHAHGLDQSPVDAELVRQEAKRKRCFDSGNFAKVLKSMKGFSAGSSRAEIVAGSKWVGEFDEAVKKAANAQGDQDT